MEKSVEIAVDIDWANEDDETLSSEDDDIRNRCDLISIAIINIIRIKNKRLIRAIITKIRIKSVVVWFNCLLVEEYKLKIDVFALRKDPFGKYSYSCRDIDNGPHRLPLHVVPIRNEYQKSYEETFLGDKKRLRWHAPH